MSVVGLTAACFALIQERRNAETQQRDVAEGVAATAQSAAQSAVSAMSGAAGLVGEDGDVSALALDAFRSDLWPDSDARVAYIPRVAAQDRAGFERAEGIGVLDFVDGRFVAAPTRGDEHWVVTRASPTELLTSALIGLDIAHLPVTAESGRVARDTGDTVMTEPIPTGQVEALDPSDPPVASGAGPSVLFVMKPAYLPGLPVATVEQRRAAHAGFIATLYDTSSIAEQVSDRFPADVRYRISDGPAVVAQSATAPSGGSVDHIEVGGRSWAIEVEDRRGGGYPLTLIVLGITALVVGGLIYLIRRSDRFESSSARGAALISRTGELARHLASAATVDDVAAVISRHVATTLTAQTAALGFLDRDAGEVRIDLGPAPQGAAHQAVQPLSEAGPITEAIRTGEVVISTDPDEWAAYAAAADVPEHLREGTRAAAGLPLRAADGSVVSAIGILWNRRVTFDDTKLASLNTIAELCEQSLHRAERTDEATLRATRLAELAERLAGAGTIAETVSIVTDSAGDPVGATDASLVAVDPDSGALRPLVDASSDVDPLACEAVTEASVVSTADATRAGVPLRHGDAVIGAMTMSWPSGRGFDESQVPVLTTIGEMVTQTLQRARLSEGQLEDARHSRELATLAQGLARLAHTSDVTGFLASAVVRPLDAMHGVAGVVHEGVMHRSRYSTANLAGRLPATITDMTPLTARTPLTDAARTGEDVLIRDLSDAVSRFPDLGESFASAGLGGSASLPLRDRTGAVIGALGVAWDHPVVFTKELRDRLRTVTGIVGQTLERTRLADMLREIAVRNEHLADLARHIAAARTVEDLCAVVSEHGGAPVLASIARLELVEESTDRIRLFAGAVARPSALGDVDGSSLYDPLPGAEAVRTRAPVVLGSPAEIEHRYPGRVSEAMRAGGMAASVHLPLVSPRGTALGSIAFAWSTSQTADPSSLATMRTVAELCAQSLERVRLGEAEHRLVSSLQRRVVTPLPPTPGVRIAQRYRPAAHQVGMGGDWYDGIELPHGRYALVVGDVAGHGITAVADMIQLRAIIEALVRGGVPVGQIFPRASALLRRTGTGVTASAFLALVDPARSSITYMAAGHPPPVLRTSGGAARVLEAGRQPLLGIPMSESSPGVVTFEPGATFVTYTDGLIERREESIDASIERLRGALDVVDGDIESTADQLIDRCLDGRDPVDDVALVVMRREL